MGEERRTDAPGKGQFEMNVVEIPRQDLLHRAKSLIASALDADIGHRRRAS
jgi:hypothetical protein